MRKSSALIVALSFALACTATTSVSAAPILGSHVDDSVFSANLGSEAGWTYEGESTGAFTGEGQASLLSRSSSYANSFGFSRTNHSGLTETFGAGAPAGSSATVAGYVPGYLLYFKANGSDFLFFSDDNTQYSDGDSSGGFPGASQGGLDIFYNAASATWAFFFDDAGGGISIAGDDNDYDDMVVTYKLASAVPEPASAALLGLGILAVGWVSRRKQRARFLA